MTKQHLVTALTETGDFTIAQASQAVDVISRSIISAVSSGQEASLPGVGTFALSIREPGTARNPATQELIHTGRRARIKFRCSTKTKRHLTEMLQKKKASRKKAPASKGIAEKKNPKTATKTEPKKTRKRTG